jgi:translation initiation factor eIF-2B subunit gamma
LPLPRPDVLAPKDLDYNTGTADILRLEEVRSLITSDFLVLPCDLVCELGGEKLLQAWMVKSASLTEVLGASGLTNGRHIVHSGGLGVWYDSKANTPIKKEETDFIATAPAPPSLVASPKDSLVHKLSKLVYSMPTDSLNDLTEERKGLPIRHGLLKANPRVRMLTTHRDAHIYIFPRWILDFIKMNERLDSIAEDVVGWWAKAGWQTGLAEKLQIKEACGMNESKKHSDEESQSSPTSESSPTILSPRRATLFQKALAEARLKADWQQRFDVSKTPQEFEVPTLHAYLHSGASQAPGSLIRRVDTAALLLAISLQLAKLPSLEESSPEVASPYAHSKKIAYPEGVKSRTTITKQDSLIDSNVTIEEKTSIKETVIGANCQINEGAKLSQCLLMEGVVVGKNCKLTKCILGKRCVIGDNSILTDCEVQENLLVEPRSESTLEDTGEIIVLTTSPSRGQRQQTDELRGSGGDGSRDRGRARRSGGWRRGDRGLEVPKNRSRNAQGFAEVRV